MDKRQSFENGETMNGPSEDFIRYTSPYSYPPYTRDAGHDDECEGATLRKYDDTAPCDCAERALHTGHDDACERSECDCGTGPDVRDPEAHYRTCPWHTATCDCAERELDDAASRLVESHGATSMEEARAVLRGEQ